MSKKALIQIVTEVRTVGNSVFSARVPVHATQGAAGADVHAFCPGEKIVVAPDEVAMVPTGLKMKLPEGTGLFVLPRGSQGRKKIKIANAPGLLDLDYTGELFILIHNESQEDYVISHEDRIAQVVLVDYYKLFWEPVEALPETARGEGCLGHTGIAPLGDGVS